MAGRSVLGLNDLTDDQHRGIAFIQGGEDALVAADVGTGKTVMSLTATCNDKRRWLVLAPLLVANETWRTEPANWEHLKHIDLRVATGDAQERLAAIESEAQYVVMNYENLPWLMETFPAHPKRHTLPFTGIIFDELDKLKDSGSVRFKELRNRIKWFERRIGLTGTLVPNNLLEVWGQVYMVDGGATFGRAFYKWRQKYFYPTDYQQYNWAPFPNTRQTIIDSLADLSVRIRAKGLPTVVYKPPHRMKLDPATMKHYKELESEFFLQLKDKKGAKRVVDAANSAVLSGKLQQICAGFSYVDGTDEAVWHSTDRFKWLRKLVTQTYTGGKQLLIGYQFKEELRMLRELWPDMPYLGGGVTPRRSREIIARWNAWNWNSNKDLDYRVMAIHPAAASHGLNLQKSGAQHIAFLTMPWSGGLWKQFIGRLARRGQRWPEVFVHTAVFANTVDERVLSVATERRDNMEDFLDDLEKATGA